MKPMMPYNKIHMCTETSQFAKVHCPNLVPEDRCLTRAVFPAATEQHQKYIYNINNTIYNNTKKSSL